MRLAPLARHRPLGLPRSLAWAWLAWDALRWHGFGRGAMRQRALMLAIREGDPEAVQSALDRGADPARAEGRCRLGATPLGLAVALRRGSGPAGLDIAMALVQAGAHPDQRCRQDPAPGAQPPMLLAMRLGDSPLAELLLGLGADPRAEDGCGLSCMELSRQWRRGGAEDPMPRLAEAMRSRDARSERSELDGSCPSGQAPGEAHRRL